MICAVVLRVIGGADTVCVRFDKKFCPYILVTRFFCIKIQTGICIILLYKRCVPLQHFIYRNKGIAFIPFVNNIVSVRNWNQKGGGGAFYNRKRRLCLIPFGKKRLFHTLSLYISLITIIGNFPKIITPLDFDHRLHGGVFRRCDKGHAVCAFTVFIFVFYSHPASVRRDFHRSFRIRFLQLSFMFRNNNGLFLSVIIVFQLQIQTPLKLLRIHETHFQLTSFRKPDSKILSVMIISSVKTYICQVRCCGQSV